MGRRCLFAPATTPMAQSAVRSCSGEAHPEQGQAQVRLVTEPAWTRQTLRVL